MPNYFVDGPLASRTAAIRAHSSRVAALAASVSMSHRFLASAISFIRRLVGAAIISVSIQLVMERCAASWPSHSGPAPEDAEALFDAATRGDADARRMVDGHSRDIGRLAVAVLAVIDPGLIVLGGGVGQNQLVVPEVRSSHFTRGPLSRAAPVVNGVPQRSYWCKHASPDADVKPSSTNGGATKSEVGMVIPVVITVYQDKSFTFITKSPPASVLLKKAAGITSGSKTPNKEKVGKVTRKQVLDIVKLKIKDLNSSSEEAAFRVVAGTARSMGIDVVG